MTRRERLEVGYRRMTENCDVVDMGSFISFFFQRSRNRIFRITYNFQAASDSGRTGLDDLITFNRRFGHTYPGRVYHPDHAITQALIRALPNHLKAKIAARIMTGG